MEVPGWMLGKAGAVARRARRVAGAHVPFGTCWEFIAAEFLSGVGLEVWGSFPDGSETEDGHVDDGFGVDVDGQPSRPVDADHLATSAQGVAERTICEESSECPPDEKASERPVRDQSRRPTSDESLEHAPSGAPSDYLASGAPSELPPFEAPSDYPPSEELPWTLHRELRESVDLRRSAARELGKLLVEVKRRRIWRGTPYPGFGHYVRERLGLSVRTAQRLVRVEYGVREQPALASAYDQGDLTPLKVELVLRVLRLGLSDGSVEAWVGYAECMTFQRLAAAVDWAIARAADDPRGWAGRDGRPPSARRRNLFPLNGDAGDRDGAEQNAPTFATSKPSAGTAHAPSHAGAGAVGPEALLETLHLKPLSVDWAAQTTTATLELWLDLDEKAAVLRAVAAVQRIRGPAWPLWACLNDLLDHFIAIYDSHYYRSLGQQYPILDRDGWRCQAPGCTSYAGLQVHHVRFRAHGGSDARRNLYTVCDFHHMAIHNYWIRCEGHAPDEIRWTLGTSPTVRGSNPRRLSPSPIARFIGHRRLHPYETWRGLRLDQLYPHWATPSS